MGRPLNRRQFFRFLGIGAVAATVAPTVLPEIAKDALKTRGTLRLASVGAYSRKWANLNWRNLRYESTDYTTTLKTGYFGGQQGWGIDSGGSIYSARGGITSGGVDWLNLEHNHAELFVPRNKDGSWPTYTFESWNELRVSQGFEPISYERYLYEFPDQATTELRATKFLPGLDQQLGTSFFTDYYGGFRP